MEKYLIAIISLILFNKSFGQSFKLKSLQGEYKNLIVEFEVPKGEIKIHLDHQYFTMENVMDIKGKVEILENNLLKVSFQRRIGSGIKQIFTSFYSVNHNSLCQSLFLESKYVEEVINTFSRDADSSSLNMNSQSNVKLSLESGLKIKADESYKYESQASPQRNFSYSTSTILKFEKSIGLFYCEKKNLKGVYSLVDDNGRNVSKKFDGDFYFINMHSHTYVFIDNVWMKIGKTNNKILGLSTFSKE